MTREYLRTVCITVCIVLAATTSAFAQTSSSTLTDLLNGLSASELQSLLSTSGLASLLGGSTTTDTTTTDTTTTDTDSTDDTDLSLTDRVGSPSIMISTAITEHQQFNAIGKMTPAEQADALGIEPAAEPVKLPIIYLFKGLVDIGAKYIPALQALADLLDGITWPTDDDDTDATPPTPVTDKGIVAYLTAADTSLRVGQTTTVYLWVQQTSPNDSGNNGIYSVAVNIKPSPNGIVQGLVPAVFVSPWTSAIPSVVTGTTVTGGGITGLAANLGISQTKTIGVSKPVLVASFQVRAVAAGTVTLAPTNYTEQGWTGVSEVTTNNMGDEEDYVPVEITVTN